MHFATGKYKFEHKTESEGGEYYRDATRARIPCPNLFQCPAN